MALDTNTTKGLIAGLLAQADYIQSNIDSGDYSASSYGELCKAWLDTMVQAGRLEAHLDTLTAAEVA